MARRSPMAVIFFTVFLDLLGFGMIIPILPLYAEHLHASDVQIGLLQASYSVMQLLFAPVWGRLSDRVGRRPVLLVSIFGSCASQLGYALAPSLLWLFAARSLAGVCGANIAAAQAYIADVTDEKSRAAGMGMLGAAFGLGFVFGPALGGLLSHWSEQLPFFVASALAGLNFVLALFILDEPRPVGERSAARRLTWRGLVTAVSSPRLLVLLVLFLVVTFGFANLEGTFALYLSRRFGYQRTGASYLYAYVGVLMILVQGVAMRRLASTVGERTLIIAGTLLMALGMGGLYLSHHIAPLLVGLGLVAVGNGVNTPSLSSLISRSAGEQQGAILGVAQSVGAIARILGPTVGTWTLAFGEGVPYLTAGVTMAVACLVAALLVQQPAASLDQPATAAPID